MVTVSVSNKSLLVTMEMKTLYEIYVGVRKKYYRYWSVGVCQNYCIYIWEKFCIGVLKNTPIYRGILLGVRVQNFSTCTTTIVVHSKDDQEVGMAHEVKSPKNQPQFS